ncbi:hypothetical protein HDK77DRAFT_510268 [Phyllosticta capitalensis]
MELLSVLDAVRCRHFTLLLALLIGFACGVLAPLANAMTSEIFSTHRELADLVISSTFDFNGTLTYPNGSVIVPPAFSRYKPYDAMVNSRSPGGQAWLNLSSCSDSDPSKLFVTATVAYVDILGDSSNGVEVEDGFLFFPSTVRNITGLVCSVEFLLWNANVTAKGSSGEIVAHNFSESSIPTKIDANFTMASVLIYLDAFMYFLWNPSENKYLHNSSTVVDAASDSTNISEMDFFFGILTDGDRENLEKYFHDPERFQLDVQTLGSSILTQLTSMRSNARPGILDNLLLSDLTYDLDCETTAGLANVKMHTRVPAISIDVSVQIEAAQLYVQNASVEDDLGCWRIGVWNCPDMFGPTVGPSETCVKQHNRFYGQADYTEGAFTLCLAHLPEIFGPVGNTTSIVLDKKLDPGDLNVSFPQVSSIRSWVNLTQVYVNTTYECTIRNIWTPIEYDRSTIDPLELTEQHHKLKFNNYTAAFLTGQLYGDSFEVDLSVSFFALLAFYAETQLQNWTALLDGDQLAEAVKNSIIAYCAELLTEYRTIARKQAKLENVEPQKVNATLLFHEERIIQDEATTVIILVLLAAIFFSYIWVFYRFSSRPILPKSPGSIAAQLSFIADSNLVRCLREDGMTRLTDDEIRGKLALGWWKREITPQDRIRGEGEETNFENDPPPLPSLRWGIDIGEPYSRQRWNKPPFFDQESENDDDHESQNEEAQNDGRSRLVDLQSQIELQNLPSRRDSETQSDEHQQQRQEENTEDASGDRSNKNTLGLDFGDTQSLNPLLIEPRFNDAASEDQRSEYSKAGNERSEAQSVAECISQPLLGPNLR